jgi:protein-tyrosine phosphatase
MTLSPQQRARLARFGAAQCVDIHCHCLPGVDDGPGTLEEAVALCRALVADGVTTAVATPHQLGRYDLRNGGPDVRKAVAALREALAREGVPLAVEPGADVRVDERLPQLLESGHVLTLADTGKFVLLELPHETFIDPLPLIRLLVARGVRPIVSHPERHRHVSREPQLVVPWLKAGALLQVTSGSLTGEFGNSAERCAWDLLSSAAVAFVASDAHGATNRPPRMTAAMDLIERRLGRDVAARVCVENPAKVLGAAAGAGPGRGGRTGGDLENRDESMVRDRVR